MLDRGLGIFYAAVGKVCLVGGGRVRRRRLPTARERTVVGIAVCRGSPQCVVLDCRCTDAVKVADHIPVDIVLIALQWRYLPRNVLAGCLRDRVPLHRVGSPKSLPPAPCLLTS